MLQTFLSRPSVSSYVFPAVELDDMYQFDPVDLKWTSIQPGDVLGAAPSARETPGFASVNGKIYVYGGLSQSGDAPSPIPSKVISDSLRFSRNPQ